MIWLGILLTLCAMVANMGLISGLSDASSGGGLSMTSCISVVVVVFLEQQAPLSFILQCSTSACGPRNKKDMDADARCTCAA
jgi:hypothetical protein